MRLKPYFSIITTAVASLTILPVFDGITVYNAIVSSHYMPSCDDCCVFVVIYGVKYKSTKRSENHILVY